MWLTTTGIVIFYLIDDNVATLASVITDFLPYSVDVIDEYITKYNKLILLITLGGTGYGKLRTNNNYVPLEKRSLPHQFDVDELKEQEW